MSRDSTPDFPQCCNCAHMREAEGCDAYGNRIPSDLWNNRYDHRAEYKGDCGLRWEPRETGLKHIRDIWRDAFCAQMGLPPTTLSFSLREHGHC